MPIRIPDLGIAIYTSPKVLSTSLKYAVFELENGRRFEEFVVSGKKNQIHTLYPATLFEPVSKGEYPHTIAFVRDPVKRFVSLFRNRVARKHPQSAVFWKRAVSQGLPENPSLNEFVTRFNDYVSIIPEVEHHATPQVNYLGSEAAFYSKVFTEKTVPDFELLIEKLSGKSFRLPWEQKSGTAVPISLSKKNLAWIKDHYSQDYEVFGRYLSPTPRRRDVLFTVGMG